MSGRHRLRRDHGGRWVVQPPASRRRLWPLVAIVALIVVAALVVVSYAVVTGGLTPR